MRPPKPDCIFEICIKKYVEFSSANSFAFECKVDSRLFVLLISYYVDECVRLFYNWINNFY